VFPVLQRFDEAASVAGVVVMALVAVSYTAFVGCVFSYFSPNDPALLTLFGLVAEVGPFVMIIAFSPAKEFIALKTLPAIVFIPFTRPSILRVTAFFAPALALHGVFGVLVVSRFTAGTIFPMLEKMCLLPNSIKVSLMIEKENWHIIVVRSVANQWFVVAEFSKYQAFEDVSSMVFVV
jgi:hypothetical protein